MPKTKVEVYDKDQLIYPFIESDHVTFSNGMKITEMLDQSISMPKVTHEDSSFKVGVGDQDVSSAIVDSSVADMTIKGQTYQNILPEPTLRNEMQGKSMQRLNEGYDNIEVVDGVSKSAILSGCTKWANANGDVFDTFFNPITEFNFENGYLLTDGTLTYDGGHFATQFIDVTNFDGIEIGKDGTYYGKLCFYDSDKNFISWVSKEGTTGIVKVTSIPSNAKYIRYSAITKNIFIKDNEGRDLSLPLSLVSVKMPVLSTVGKNLFDKDAITLNKCLTWATGVENTENNSFISDYIKVENGIHYSVSGASLLTSRLQVFGYDKDKKPICGFNKSGSEVELGYSSGVTNNSIIIKNSYYIRVAFRNLDGVMQDINNIQIEESSTTTPYEPYKSNILSVNEPIELRGIGDVQDELDLLTGEVTERIGELVITDNTPSKGVRVTDNGMVQVNIPISVFNTGNGTTSKDNIRCDKFTWSEANILNPQEGLRVNGNTLHWAVSISKLSSTDLIGVNNYLSNNPITVQYQLATEKSIKTVDLSSHGNWEKIVLDGTQTINQYGNMGYYYYGISIPNITPYVYGGRAFADKLLSPNESVGSKKYTISPANSLNILCFTFDGEMSRAEVIQYLQQNPITAWYQTTTTQDNSIREMLSFANGHLQVSSEAENSLLPSVQYEIPTKNSYHMDLMKANTTYTMKLTSGNGSINKWDGESIGFMLSRTFNSGTLPKSNLFYTTGWVNDLMILEGDVTSKTIPYFKGIKSAFEGEDKIEVLSTGKNLFDPYSPFDTDYYGSEGKCLSCYYDHEKKLIITEGVSGKKNSQFPFLKFKPNTTYIFSGNVIGHQQRFCIHNESKQIEFNGTGYFSLTVATGSSGRLYVSVLKVGTPTGVYGIENLQIEESLSATTHETHKSNNTKIPLLSPLRSLPNGVCDELVIDRENNKAKIIQRVGEVVPDGKEDWLTNSSFDTTETKFFYLPNSRIPNTWGRIFSGWRHITNNRFVSNTDRMSAVNQKIEWISGGDGANGMIQIIIKKERLSTPDVSGFKQWLSQNPVMVYYELETPIITEVDLEGFPYIYKDGHIFLNSEIVPTMEITYSINQSQQISASNEDIIRHEKELTYLQKLIAQYIQVEYESTLLSLKI